MVNAVKEQQTTIQQQTAEISQQNTEIALLKERLQRIEAVLLKAEK